MYSMPVRTVWTFFVAGDAVPGVHVAERRILPAGDEHGEVLLGGGDHPRVFRIDLIDLRDRAVAQTLVHELVREGAPAGLILLAPGPEPRRFDPPHGFPLGDAR